MGWYLDDVRIFIQEEGGAGKNIIAEVQPLLGPSIYQKFGYESAKRRYMGLVVGATDRDRIISFATTGNQYGIIDSGTVVFSGYIANVTWNNMGISNQTIRPDLDCETPVYRMNFDMW